MNPIKAVRMTASASGFDHCNAAPVTCDGPGFGLYGVLPGTASVWVKFHLPYPGVGIPPWV